MTDQLTSPDGPILVTGGSGTLGRLVVAQLRDAGCTVRVLARGRHPHDPTAGVEFVTCDLMTGDNLDAAVAGAPVIVHLAGTMKGDDVKARVLVEAARRHGHPHLVFISVVGADRIPVRSAADRAMFGYFASKRAAEVVIEESGLPWSILRATQFHDLTFATVRAMAKLPLIPVPSGFRFQPVATNEVATRLVALALGAPAGLVPDVGGPQIHAMRDLVRSYLDATHRRRLLLAARMPGGAASAIRAGANLTPDHAIGRQTWAEFLANQVARTARPPAAEAPQA